MAYEVTATRKRPKIFDHLVGQDFVVSTLRNSVEGGKIAHAYLFAGPRGVGKTSAARILARSLNCEEGPAAVPCGKCANCNEIVTGNSLDVIEIDGASNTSVNDVREIRDEVLFAPNTSRYKVYIIDEVHMLSHSAFNALLKTIEEPPPYVVFIFATTEVHKVPATIRSRCQQFNFRLISLEQIKANLIDVASELKIEAEDEALLWIAKEATGSLRDAYTLFDQIASFAEQKVTFELLRQKLGLVGYEALQSLMDNLADQDAAAAIVHANDILNGGVSVERFIIDIAEYLRNLLFLKQGITKESILGNSPERLRGKAYEVFSDVQIEKGLSLVLQLYRDIRYSLNQRFELELLLSRLSLLATFIHPRELVKKVETLRSQLGVSNTVSPVSDPLPSVKMAENAPLEDTSELTSESWNKIVDTVRKSHLALAASLGKLASWELSADTLVLVCGSGFDADTINRDRDVLSQAVSQITGNLPQIKVTSQRESAEEDAGSDERVEMIKRIFRGKIIGDT